MSFPLFFVTFHQHCLVTCGCLTTMPKQSNGIPVLIYIFDRTPRKSKEFVPSSVLFYFHSYVCPFVNFGCLVFTSSLWWHLRHQVKRFIERSRNGIYIMYVYMCVCLSLCPHIKSMTHLHAFPKFYHCVIFDGNWIKRQAI